MLHNIMFLFGDVEPFLTKNSDIGPSLRPKLLDMLHHLPTVIQLKVELAIVINFGEPFVTGCSPFLLLLKFRSCYSKFFSR